MRAKIVSIHQSIQHMPHYVSNSLGYELGIDPENWELFQRCQKLSNLFIECFRHSGKLSLKAILRQQTQYPEIKTLLNMIDDYKDLRLIQQNIAYKALILAVRTWPKRNWHVHFSDHIDGHFVMESIGVPQKAGYDYRTNTYHINDDWIQTADDFVYAFKYVVYQLIEDGITSTEIRFNPYKRFIGEDHQVRLNQIGPLLGRLYEATKNIVDKHAFFEGTNFGFTFSLNRRKYGRENPQVLIDIIQELTQLKKNIADPVMNRALKGIDICGGEILEWEWDGHRHTEWGMRMFDALQEAHKAGYEIISHLGDLRNYNEKLSGAFYQNPEPVIHSMLLNFESYILHLQGLTRIGHATILHDQVCTSDRNRKKMNDVISILHGKVPESLVRFVPGLSQQDLHKFIGFMNHKGYMTVNSVNSFVKNLIPESSSGYHFLAQYLQTYDINLTADQIRKLIQLCNNIYHAKSILLERCFYDDVYTLNDIHDKSPLFFWKDQEIHHVLGIDGFIHNRTPEHYDFFSERDFLAISLSQWIVMVMLAAPEHNGWTVNYVKSLVQDNTVIQTASPFDK